MPAYEICYLEDDGALACAFSVQFETALRAKILAHAMKPAQCRRIEIWEGRSLVYQRPDFDELDAAALMAHTPAHEHGHVGSAAE